MFPFVCHYGGPRAVGGNNYIQLNHIESERHLIKRRRIHRHRFSMLFLAYIHCLFVGTWPLPGYDTFSQVGQH